MWPVLGAQARVASAIGGLEGWIELQVDESPAFAFHPRALAGDHRLVKQADRYMGPAFQPKPAIAQPMRIFAGFKTRDLVSKGPIRSSRTRISGAAGGAESPAAARWEAIWQVKAPGGHVATYGHRGDR